jgi:hypothetical protein
MDCPPQYWLVQPFSQPPSKTNFISTSCCPAVSHMGLTSFLNLSFSRLFLQVTCLSILRSFATQRSHTLKDFLYIVLLYPWYPLWFHEYRGYAASPGQSRDYPGLGYVLLEGARYPGGTVHEAGPPSPCSPWHGSLQRSLGSPFSLAAQRGRPFLDAPSALHEPPPPPATAR